MDDIEIKQAMIKRLRELADGAEPKSRGEGICKDIKDYVNERRFYVDHQLEQSFIALCVDWQYPIAGRDEYERTYDLWTDDGTFPHGTARRQLCAKVADYLESTLTA